MLTRQEIATAIKVLEEIQRNFEYLDLPCMVEPCSVMLAYISGYYESNGDTDIDTAQAR